MFSWTSVSLLFYAEGIFSYFIDLQFEPNLTFPVWSDKTASADYFAVKLK